LALCRISLPDNTFRLGWCRGDDVFDLTAVDPVGCSDISAVFTSDDPIAFVHRQTEQAEKSAPTWSWPELLNRDSDRPHIVAPIDRQEVWAAGVTYTRSRDARMAESETSASVYDRVYDADRPELFLKSTPERVSDPLEPVRVRHDSNWTVPEPELALVISSNGKFFGFTAGNDMSARDIEGDNPLYLPQAKT